MARPMARQRVQGGPGAAQWLADRRRRDRDPRPDLRARHCGRPAVVALTATHDQTAAEPARKPGGPGGAAKRADRSGSTERPPQEKLTFYQDAHGAHEPGPASRQGRARPAKPEPATPRRSRPSARPAIGRAAATPPSPPKPDKPAAPAERPSAAPRRRRRGPATGPCRSAPSRIAARPRASGDQLAAAGFDAYLTAVRTADGADALPGAHGQLHDPGGGGVGRPSGSGSERSLTAFVTPK